MHLAGLAATDPVTLIDSTRGITVNDPVTIATTIAARYTFAGHNGASEKRPSFW
jgi:hypothetical protein